MKTSSKSLQQSITPNTTGLCLDETVQSNLLDCWRTLPYELKHHVISLCDLPVAQTFGYNICLAFRKKFDIQPRGYDLTLLLAPREISDIAREFVGSKNTFRLPLYVRSPRGGICYPSQGMNQHIRRLEIELILHPRYWKFLHKLASGALGFTKLSHVRLMVVSHASSSMHVLGPDQRIINAETRKRTVLPEFIAIMRNDPITFTVDKLEIIFVKPISFNHGPEYKPTKAFRERDEIIENEVKPLLLKCLTVKSGNGDEIPERVSSSEAYWDARKRILRNGMSSPDQAMG